MTDELLRPFRDKLRGRLSTQHASETVMPIHEETIPPDTILIHEVRAGLFPEASRLHTGFVPGIPRIRLTLDVGASFRGEPRLRVAEREALLAFCPRLRDHDCGAGDEIRRLFATDDVSASMSDDHDGLAIAHLIEHVAIEMIVMISGVARSSGVTCAHRDRLDRFDIFLETIDPLVGRAAAILAAAVVRDLCLRRAGRLALHRRCLDLLTLATTTKATRLVAEDAASHLRCGPDEGLQALEELVRLGYLTAAPSPYLFSSATGVLFRRSAVEIH